MSDSPITVSLRETPVVHQWRERYQQDLRRAEERGDLRNQQRLYSYGTWKNSLLDVIILVVFQILFTIPVAAAALGIYLLTGHHFGAHGLDDPIVQDWLSTPQVLTAYALASQAAILAVLQLRVIGRQLLTWHDLGLSTALRQRPLQSIALGVVLGFAALILSGVILLIMQRLGFYVNGQEDDLSSVKHTHILLFLPFAFTGAITAPLVEELFFRGYLFRALATRFPVPLSLILSALFFGLLHLTGGAGWAVGALTCIGVLLAWGYARTGNILTNITAHTLNNIIGLLILYQG